MYTITLDNNNYILSVAHTNHDNVELDLSVIDLEFLNCYQLINGVPILDKSKKAQTIAENKIREDEEKHRVDIDEQTLRLAEMFISQGINVDDFLDRVDAQTLYTALMTDTLIEE